MNIFLTNDDGLGSPGLNALENELGKKHSLWTVAPEKEMSGQSHSITLIEGLKLNRVSENRFSVRGTPVDCINLGFQAVIPSKPDLMISGINRGPNLGTDIVYSGTCAAAREAGLRGIPSIAVSCSSMKGPWNYSEAAAFIAENLENFLELWQPDVFLNINWPDNSGNKKNKKKVRLTFPGKRRYKDKLISFVSPRGDEYWFLEPASVISEDAEGSDSHAVNNGDISISRVFLEPAAVYNSSDNELHDKISWEGL